VTFKCTVHKVSFRRNIKGYLDAHIHLEQSYKRHKTAFGADMTKHTGNVCETINSSCTVNVVPSQWCSPGQESWSAPVLGLLEMSFGQPAKREKKTLAALSWQLSP